MPKIMEESSWFVYILRCADDSLYTGITNCLERRLARHNRGQASRYTRARLPVELVYSESQTNRSSASKREAEMKAWARNKKLDWIQGHSPLKPHSPPHSPKPKPTES